MKSFGLALLPIALFATFAAAAPTAPTPASEPEAQEKYCRSDDMNDFGHCPKGSLMFYERSSESGSGSLGFAAENCDFSRQVIYDNAGVICFKGPAREAFNPAEEGQNKAWTDFKDTISKDKSWTEFNKTLFYKIIEKPEGEIPALPKRIFYKDQPLDLDKNPVGKAKTISFDIEKKDATMGYLIYSNVPIGTKILVFEFNKDEPRKSIFDLMTLTKVQALPPKDTAKPAEDKKEQTQKPKK